MDQILNVKAILLCFEAVSGLKVSLFKCELIGCRIDCLSLREFANLLGCKAGSLPTFYLGLPLCLGKVGKPLQNPVIERMEKQLALWKAKYLSFAGHISLLKSALSNLSIHFMLLFKCPSLVVKWIENCKGIFCGSEEGKKKGNKEKEKEKEKDSLGGLVCGLQNLNRREGRGVFLFSGLFDW